MQKPCYILGIESSCDDTAAAILENDIVLSNVIAKQEIHVEYGGVVPELASRAHQINIIPVVEMALKKAGIEKKQLNAVAYTRGPGLLGSLLIGSSFSKSLSMGLKIPLIEVNHMHGHILCHFIDNKQNKPEFPFLGITVSGGHTQIVMVEDYFTMNEIGGTLDDAIGEAFDKCGKAMGFDYPAGPIIDKYSKNGNPKKFKFPIPNVKDLDFSFSGFKTSVLNFINKNVILDQNFIKNNVEDLCASVQYTLIEILMLKINLAVKKTGITQIAIGGGVAANSELRKRLNDEGKKNNWKTYIPNINYTTDNAAMIALVGYLKYKNSHLGNLKQKALSNYKI